ncbi:hypothetical protein BU14_0234s0007 [Porphyra umbilicalis]|uniref:Cytochrome P450 n=1 Tax=Porphyra umbilicalis TaxID=2786 RepID=A0A1X6P3Z8_PORUM|nr:hypothetical protein BU14_0234s0007 [Porphyra umbilicalis]|eukprot:OSX75480.1 hypothetical protein BU14_0234s0007 [Porphyra umbilicalis]
MEPPGADADASLRADAPAAVAAVLPTLDATMRAALGRTWGVGGDRLRATLDGAMRAEVGAAAAAAGPTDLFRLSSRAALRAGAAAFLGPAFDAAHGAEVWAGIHAWQPAAFSLPWFLAPRAARRVRPAIGRAFDVAYRPMEAHIGRVLAGEVPAEGGTYLAALLAGVDAATPRPPVTAAQVATHIFGVLVALHINVYATGAWAVAHVAGDAGLSAAAAAEVDDRLAGRPPPMGGGGGGGGSPPPATGLPVLEGVWAEALRVYFVTPSLRLAKAPWHVAASDGNGAAGARNGDRRTRPGWTVPGDGRLVAISIVDVNRRGGGGRSGGGAPAVWARRFVPPAGTPWRAAEQARTLYAFAWGPHVCVGRRVAEALLERWWVALYGAYAVTRVSDAQGGGGGGGGCPRCPRQTLCTRLGRRRQCGRCGCA